MLLAAAVETCVDAGCSIVTDVVRCQAAEVAETVSHLLRALLTNCYEKSPIAATAYGAHGGVPTCFHRQIFQELSILSGDQGAKSVIPS